MRVTPAKRGSGRKRRQPAGENWQDRTPAERHVAMIWMQRLKRVFNIDIEICERCAGQVKIIAHAQPPRVWRHTEPAEDLQARAERDNKIFALGYAPTAQYIEETYGPGWEKEAEPELPPEDPKGPLPAEFTEISELALKRAGHRADQQALVHGAERMATQYHELNGKRVEQILGYLEETDDLDTFRRRLTDMLSDLPEPAAVEKVRNANWYARLMGLDRGRG